MEANDGTIAGELARALDYLTEEQVSTLGNLKDGTLGAWRKRGKGPPFLRFGNQVLYPKHCVAEYLCTLVREPANKAVAASLL